MSLQTLKALPEADWLAESGYTLQQSTLFSRRGATFLAVACLHAAVLYGLAMGMGSEIVKLIPPPLVVRIFPPPPRSQQALPPKYDAPSMTFKAPPNELPPPILATPDAPEMLPYEPPRIETGPQLPPVINREQGGPGPGFPSTNDYYPSISIFKGEQGVATVQACVDGKGRLTAEPTIIQSTGSSRLDEGAIRLAKAGSGHYRATTENGRAVSACYPFRIRFDLRN
jgi:TonB family protein